MKSLFVFCKNNFEFLLQSLPKYDGLAYCFFSEIKLLNAAIKQKKPDALLFKGVEFNDVISSCISVKDIDYQIPIIISGKISKPNIPTLQIYSLPDKFNKTELFRVFSKLNLVNKNSGLFQDILENIVQHLSMGISFKNENLDYIACNDLFLKEYKLNNITNIDGLSDNDLFPCDIAKRFIEQDNEILKKGASLPDCKKQYSGNGEPLQFNYKSKIPIKNNNGEIVMLMELIENPTDRTKREKQEENQQFLNLLMDNIPDKIYFKDRESRYTKINYEQAVTLGTDDPEKAVGKCDADFFGSDQSKEAFEDEQTLMNTGIPLINKLERIETPKGEKYLKATKVALMDANGNCIGMVGISRDITNEYQLEKELRKEKGFLDLLMKNMPSRIYFKDRKSRFVRSNMALAKIFELSSPEEMYGKTDLDFFESVHAKEAFEDEQKIMSEGTPIINKLESYLKDGERFWERTTKVPFFNDQNEIIGIVGITNDFSEQKRLEDKLEKEKELLQILMDNVPDHIYFKDTDLKYIRVNKAIANFFKVDVDEIIGMSDSDFLSKEIAEKIHKQELKILVGGMEVINKIGKLKAPDGKMIWLSRTKVPIKHENSKITGLVGVSRDVTMQELTKQSFLEAKIKAEGASKAKSLFLANMSHEIRTPMNGIIGMADILSKSKLKPLQVEYLDIIMKSGQTLLALINDILDFSKIESGKMELEMVPISIRNIIEEVADIHVVHATEKSIDLLAYVDPKIPEFVDGDYIRLKQIITNLVNNAIKFTSKGEVVIHVDYIGESNRLHEIQFKVKDSGIGITKENRKKLFKSFSQVDSSTTRKYGGTGLGLAISQRLVAQIGGKLDFNSSVNSGSTFFFKCKFAISNDIKKNNMFLGKEQLRKKHIVIVDDNETNRLIFRNYLETWHVKVSEFSDGFKALSFLKKQSITASNPVDLVLLDYQMPGMSGKELAQRIKSDQRISCLKLILLSSITDSISVKEMNKAGFETGSLSQSK